MREPRSRSISGEPNLPARRMQARAFFLTSNVRSGSPNGTICWCRPENGLPDRHVAQSGNRVRAVFELAERPNFSKKARRTTGPCRLASTWLLHPRLVLPPFEGLGCRRRSLDLQQTAIKRTARVPGVLRFDCDNDALHAAQDDHFFHPIDLVHACPLSLVYKNGSPKRVLFPFICPNSLLKYSDWPVPLHVFTRFLGVGLGETQYFNSLL